MLDMHIVTWDIASRLPKKAHGSPFVRENPPQKMGKALEPNLGNNALSLQPQLKVGLVVSFDAWPLS